MKSLLTFTLAAGVAITTTSVVHAAGVPKTGAAEAKSVSARQTPANSVNSRLTSLDRTAFNRELSRLSELLEGSVGDDLMNEEVAVGRKTSQTFIF